MRRNPRYSVQQSTEGGRVCWRIFDGSSDTGKYFFTESGARNRMGMLPGYDGSSAPAPTQVQTPTPSFVPPIPPRAPTPTPTVEVERDYSPISRGPRLEGAQRKGHIKVAPTDLSRPVIVSIRGQEYTVKETSRKRSQDLRRFEVWKPGQATPYVITFQNPNGSIAACSCPNAIYRQQGCKHIEGVIKAIREVSMARYNPRGAKFYA